MIETTRQGLIIRTNKLYTQFRQQVREDLPDDIIDIIKRHYTNGNEDYYVDVDCSNKKRNYYKDIRIEGFIEKQYSNLQESVERIIGHLKNKGILGVYFNVFGVEEVKSNKKNVILKMINKFGINKQREEKVDNIFNYALRIIKDEEAKNKIKEKYESIEKSITKYRRRVTNIIQEKVDYIKTKIKTCQSDGVNENSVGYHDLFLNGANALLFVQDGDGAINGRALIRIMLDDNGQEYLFIDRYYANGELANQYTEIFIAIIKQLYQKATDMGMKIAVSDTSEHTTPNYVKLDNSGCFDLIKSEYHLRTPARTEMLVDVAYYSDSGVVTYYYDDGEKRRYREKINKQHVYIINKVRDDV